MIVSSFVTLFFVGIITIIGLAISLNLYRKVPPAEIIFVVFCLIFELLDFIFYSVNYFFSKETMIHQETIIFERLGYFCSIIAIMMISYAIIFIDFRYSYNDLFELIFFTWIGVLTAIYNAVTFKVELSNGVIRSIYNPIGILFVIIFFIMVLIIWIRRFIKIAKIYYRQGKVDKIYRSMIIFLSIGILLVIVYLMSVSFYNYEGDNSFLMGGFFTLVGSMALYKNNAFLFITDVELDSVIIVEKTSSILLYSKKFSKLHEENDDYNSNFIGSVISAINISFSNIIRSQKELTELTFSDKTVLVFSGKVVMSILIVSSPNLITKSILKFINNRFETLFAVDINNDTMKSTFIGVESNYWIFDSVINYVRTFLPL